MRNLLTVLVLTLLLCTIGFSVQKQDNLPGRLNLNSSNYSANNNCHIDQSSIDHPSPHRDETVYEYGFENGWNDWTTLDLTDPGHQWHLSQENAFDGESWWCGDEDLGGYDSHWLQYLITPSLDFGGHENEPASLRFRLFYAVEGPGGAEQPYDGWDGCNVWISTDGGDEWEVIEPTQPRYNCESLFCFGQVWDMGPNIPGWGGFSDGWVEAEFDLGDYAGEGDVRIRWALCSDNGIDAGDDEDLVGMFIDNIVITAGRELVYSNNGEEDDMELDQGPVWGDHWEISDDDVHDGDFSAHCPVQPNLRNVLISPPIELPEGQEIHFSFWVHVDAREPDPDNDNFLDDYFCVDISDDGLSWERVIYDYGRNNDWLNNWIHYEPGVWFIEDPQWAHDLDLSQWAGETIRLRWVFITDDNMEGDQGTGLWIDDFYLWDDAININEVAIGERISVGTTWYDYQANGSTSKMIAVDDDGGVHFVWTNGFNAQQNPRHVCYNYHDEEGELIVDFDENLQIHDGNSSGYGNLALLPEDDRAVIFYQGSVDNQTLSLMAIDFMPGLGAFMEAEIPLPEGVEEAVFPHGNLSRNNCAHVIIKALNQDPITHLYYTRGAPSRDFDEWEFTDPVNFASSAIIAYTVSASRVSDKTSLVYLSPAYDEEEFDVWFNDPFNAVVAISNNLFMLESENGEDFDWDNPVNITNVLRPDPDAEEDDPLRRGDIIRPFAYVDAVYDNNDNLHIIFVTVEFWERLEPDEDGHVADRMDPRKALLWHWDRDSDEIHLVADAWYEEEGEPASFWTPNISCPSIGVDEEDNLYCAFTVYPEEGDIAGNGVSNMDIFATVSEDGGHSWARAVNITDTHAPDAEAGDCLSEWFSSLAERVDDHLHISYVLDRDPGAVVMDIGAATLNQFMYHSVAVEDIPREPLIEDRPFHVEGEIPGLRHFVDFVRTDANHILLITEFTFEGEEVPTGWEIGVFTPAGTLAGGVVWIEGELAGFPAWGDDPETEDIIDGFRADEAMTFRAWDDEANVEYAAVPDIMEGEEVWTFNGFTVFHLQAIMGHELVVPLEDGWNMISINVTPTDEMFADNEDRGPDIVLMTEQLRIDEDNHHILLLKNGFGQFYAPRWDFCNIPYWDLTQGYLVKVDDDVEAIWDGEPIAPDADVPLGASWNMIAYFPQYELDASAPDFYVLSPIIENVQLAKDGYGRFFNPQFRFSNMLPWRQTWGYQVKVNADVVLNYPDPEEEGIARSVSVINQPLREMYWMDPVITDENMSVLVTGFEGFSVDVGDQVAAFSTEDVLVGVGMVDADNRCGLVVFGDDLSTEEIDGLREDEAFELWLWNSGEKVETNLKVAMLHEGQGLVYRPNDFIALDVVLNKTVPDEFYLAQAYPNPFNSITRLAFGLPEASNVAISVYDVNGRLVANLVDGKLLAGYHVTIWDAGTASTGVYLVRMEASGLNNVRKVILLR